MQWGLAPVHTIKFPAFSYNIFSVRYWESPESFSESPEQKTVILIPFYKFQIDIAHFLSGTFGIKIIVETSAF